MNEKHSTADVASAKPNADQSHIPTPWRLGDRDPSHVVASQLGHRIRIAEVCYNLGTGDANAAFIVLAVNCHDVLIAELAKQRDTMADLHHALGQIGHHTLGKACAIARDSAAATLRMARGEA